MRKLVKILYIVASVGLFIWLLYVALDEGLGDDILVWLAFLGFELYLVVSIYYAISYEKTDDLLGLWFKRKRLEQKKKIEKIEKDD